MKKNEAIQRVEDILKGIAETDGPHGEEGWWETSAGADFGAKKLAEIKKLVSEIFSQAGQ